MTTTWAYLCVVGLLMMFVDAQSSQNVTQSAPGANSSDVTTTESSSTVSMDMTSTTSAPLSVNITSGMPSSSNESSSTSGGQVPLVPQFVEQPPSFSPPPPPAQFNPASDDVTDLSLSTSGNWLPGKFPPPGMTSAAGSGNAETTTPTTTPLTVVEVGNVPTMQNDDKHKYDVNDMPNDAPAETQSSTKDSIMGSTVGYSKEAGSSAQQKTTKGNGAETSRAQLPILAVSFLLALMCSSRM